MFEKFFSSAVDAIKGKAGQAVKSELSKINLTKIAKEGADQAQKVIKDAVENKTFTVKFDELPKDVEELKKRPEATFKEPYYAAALCVAVLATYPDDKDNCIEMLNFLKGPEPLSEQAKQFLKDRFAHQSYVPISYFEGAKPDNNYTPSKPYTLKIQQRANSLEFEKDGYITYYVQSGGADSLRMVKVRKKPSTGQWFLYEHQFLLPDIRKKVDDNPWA